MLCLGRILTSKSLTKKRGRAATVVALDLHACSHLQRQPQSQPGSTAPAHAQALCLQQPTGGLLAAGLRPAGLGARSVEAPAATEPAGRGAAGQQRGLRHRKAAAPVAAAPTGKNPAGAAASETAPPAGADSRAEPPAGAPTYSGSDPSGRATCRRGQRPRPAAQAAAGRVAAAAAAKRGKDIRVFCVKDSFAPRNLRNSSFYLLSKLRKYP